MTCFIFACQVGKKTSVVIIVWLLQGEMPASKSDKALKVIHGRSFLVAGCNIRKDGIVAVASR